VTAATARRRCPRCATTSLGADRYCERCGTRLVALPRAIPVAGDRQELAAGRAGAASDRGPVRRRNEDAVFVHADDRAAVAVVCDGVGSAALPHAAARAAADVAGDVLRRARRVDQGMIDAVAAARKAVAAIEWDQRGAHVAPSCTLVAASCSAGAATIASIGDSRAYWVDDHDVVQLTRDDSWANEQIRTRTRTARQVMADRRAHMITAWVGADAPGGPPQLVHFTAPRTGRLVLCTDGLWNAVPVDDLARLVRTHPASVEPVTVARALADAAVHGGGRDNVTVAVVDLAPLPSTARQHP
jgi:serine/threonine protein phosphatase PrpC